MILFVWFYYKDRLEIEVLVYVFLDNVSDIIFIKMLILRSLGVEGFELKLKLYIMYGDIEILV